MPIVRANYSSRPETALGVKSPGSRAMRLGAEIETGWHNQNKFDAFHEALSARGLHDKVVSKPDGSIRSGFQAEIVTLPFTADKLRDIVGVIGDTLAHEDHAPYVSIAGCGVHVHISKGPVSELNRVRYMSSVMFDENSWVTQGLDTPDDAVEQVAHLNKFWDLIALREQGDYRRRRSVVSNQLRILNSHDYACIIGAHTPTLELRIFKTCRSPKVLRSYPEVAASLIAFVTETAPREPDIPPMTMGEWWNENMAEFLAWGPFWVYWNDEIRAALASILEEQGHTIGSSEFGPITCYRGTCSDAVRHRKERGTVLKAASILVDNDQYSMFGQDTRWGGLQRSLTNMTTNFYNGDPVYGHHWEAAVNSQEMRIQAQFPSWYYQMEPTPEEKRRMSLGNNVVPRLMWPDGLFPVEKYTEYVLSHISLYPNLASRLELPRFVPFLEPLNRLNVRVEIEFDRTQPHDDLGRGCLVHSQGYPTDKRVVHKFRDGYAEFADGHKEAEENLLHICEGATRLESWGE